jgi:Bacterial Ig-like domain (group 3)/FG-GAP-like repeat
MLSLTGFAGGNCMLPRNLALVLCVALLLLVAPADLTAGAVFKAYTPKYDTGGYVSSSIAIADVNRDGNLDAIVANACGGFNCGGSNGMGVVILLGNGDGTFRAPIEVGESGVAIAVADVNGDGEPDLIEIQGFGAPPRFVSVQLGNGDGTFQAAQTFDAGGSYPEAVTVSDVNGDGKLDLIVTNSCPIDGCGQDGVVGVLIGNGDGTFQPTTRYAAGGKGTYAVAVGDMNRDGKPDILVTNREYPGSVGILLGNADGTFQTVQTLQIGTGSSIAIADVNADGKPDLLLAGDGGAIYLGNGDGTFQEGHFLGFFDEITVADMNRDGKLDIIAATRCVDSPGQCAHGTVSVLLGNGDGTFQAPETYHSGGDFAASIAVADVNEDAKPDLLVANWYCSYRLETTGCVGVLLNKYFASTTTTLTSSQNPSVSGEPVTLTATVVSAGSDLPTGRIVFENSGAWIGAATMNGGTTKLTISKLPTGRLLLSAVYLGDVYSGKSTSPVLTQVVNSPQ